MIETSHRMLARGKRGGRIDRRNRSSHVAVGCEALEGRELLTVVHPLALHTVLPRHVVVPVVHRVIPVVHAPVIHRVTPVVHAPVVHRVLPVRTVVAPHRGLTTVTHPSVPSAAVQQAEQTLTTDLNNIAVRDNLPPAQVGVFQNDVKADEAAATKPASAASVVALQTEYATEAASGNLNLAILEADANVVLASAGVPQTLIAQTAADLQPLVTAPGLTLADAAIIDADLVAVVTAGGTSA